MTGCALPDDWAPSSGDIAYGHDLGFNRVQIDGIAEDMRLWAGANANRAVGRKANWSMAFKGWMRRVAAKQGMLHGSVSSRPGTLSASFDRLIAEAESRDGSFDFGSADDEGRGFEGRK